MPDSAPIAVLMVDDEPAVLWGLEKLIAGEWPRMTVAGKTGDPAVALTLAAHLQPDVILLDLSLGDSLSLDFLPAFLRCSSARILVFTGMHNRALHAQALQDGASGVVLKDESAEVLLSAIVSVANGAIRPPSFAYKP